MARLGHLLINALFLNPRATGGPETYVRGLVQALHGEYPALRITVATSRSGARALQSSGWHDWAEIVAMPCEEGQRVRRQWAEQVLLPRLLRSSGADLMHSTASVAAIRAGGPHVITLHDVTFMRQVTFGRLTTWGMSQVISRAARNADQLVTGSIAARDEICAQLGIDRERFIVVPHGRGRVASAPTIDEGPARLRFELGDGPVVLCVGAKRPHKNQEVLIRALPELDGVLLVLAGHAEPYEERLREIADQIGVADRVRFLGYLPDGELEALWALSACAAFPTLGEGFGLPLLEALDRGVSIAASDIPVLREVGGELPVWFDPRDPSSAARALRDAIADTRTATRGPDHAAGFTWQAAARGTMTAYERALDTRH